jgi:hypothetical protein
LKKLVAELTTHRGNFVKVVKKGDQYNVFCDGVLRHPNINADSAIGAMAWYCHEEKMTHSINFEFIGLQLNDTQEIEKVLTQRIRLGGYEADYIGQMNWPEKSDLPLYHIEFRYDRKDYCFCNVRQWMHD